MFARIVRDSRPPDATDAISGSRAQWQKAQILSLPNGLAALIASRQGLQTSDVVVSTVERLRGGMSREAWLAELVVADTPVRAVLLRLSDGAFIDSDMSYEFNLMKELHEHHAVPVPEPLWLDPNGEFLGSPGFLTRFARGDSSPKQWKKFGPKTRERLYHNYVSSMAELHSFPIHERHMFSSGQKEYLRLELARWKKQFESSGNGEPGIYEALAWLDEFMPVNLADPVLVHGDFRYGNFLYEGDQITALLDWELAHVGHRLEDVVWGYRPLRAETHPPADLPHTLGKYESLTGTSFEEDEVLYFRILSEVKTAIIYSSALTALMSTARPDFMQYLLARYVPMNTRQALAWIDSYQSIRS